MMIMFTGELNQKKPLWRGMVADCMCMIEIVELLELTTFFKLRWFDWNIQEMVRYVVYKFATTFNVSQLHLFLKHCGY